MQEITPNTFKELLPTICNRETSQDPAGWTPENPLWGHCAVVCLAAQNLFGGELLRASLTEVPGFEHMRSHYWNTLAVIFLSDELLMLVLQYSKIRPQGNAILLLSIIFIRVWIYLLIILWYLLQGLPIWLLARFGILLCFLERHGWR